MEELTSGIVEVATEGVVTVAEGLEQIGEEVIKGANKLVQVLAQETKEILRILQDDQLDVLKYLEQKVIKYFIKISEELFQIKARYIVIRGESS